MHLHHLVWGICLVLICGFLAFAAPLTAPWWHIVAIGFGIGAVGALRLGEPTSLWARRRYSAEQRQKAAARFAPDRRGAVWRRRVNDLVAGAPSRDDGA